MKAIEKIYLKFHVFERTLGLEAIEKHPHLMAPKGLQTLLL